MTAGVSVTTVSHALNGKGRLPRETRERVRRAARQLGYRPNATARNLVGGKSGILGFAVSQPRGLSFAFSDFAYFVQLMTAATTAAIDEGYALILAPTSRGLGAAAGLPLDGAIIVDPVADDPMVAELLDSGIPLVTTGRVLGARGTGSWVDNDHVAGARSVLDHLTRRGARRIALMTSPTEMTYTADVERSYRAWCRERDMTPLIARTKADLTESAGYAVATQLLSLVEPPDAIYATYDRLGFGAMLAAEAQGVAIPHDLLLAVTATEGGSAKPPRPSLTALNLHPEQLGQRAAELLVSLIEGRELPSTHMTVPTRLIARASTRRPISSPISFAIT